MTDDKAIDSTKNLLFYSRKCFLRCPLLTRGLFQPMTFGTLSPL